MLAWIDRLPLEQVMVMTVGVALLIMQGPMIAYSVIVERRSIEELAERRARTALDMIEEVHVQSMLNRDRIISGQLTMPTLESSMNQLMRVNQTLDLWIFQGAETNGTSTARGTASHPGPRDAVDVKAIEDGQLQSIVVDDVLRVARPVIQGDGRAADVRCRTCHAAAAERASPAVIGGYSAALDISAELAQWRRDAVRQALSALAVLLLTIALISSMLHLSMLRPLRRLADITRRLASGDATVAIDGSSRPDELGAMTRSLAVFRTNLLARQQLEREGAAAQLKLRHLASHDALTGLANRILFAERVESAMAIARRQAHSLAVLCIDVDRFKEVNDTLGHAAGDELLKKVATCLKDCIRATDTVARIGGDEFAIVQLGPVRTSDVETLCSRLITVFEEPWPIQGQDVQAGLSIGVALGPDDAETADMLIKKADLALHQAKMESRRTFRFFVPAMNSMLTERKAMEKDLKSALDRDEFQLHYQPTHDLRTGQVVSVEALLRWHHLERGWVSPAEFVPIAEANGLILPIGEWVLRTACRQAARWPELVVAVNLSPVQFRHPDLVGLVRDVLDQARLSAQRLEVEITEGVLLDDVEGAARTLNALKKLGTRIAMDDFGTGYSSLSYLQRFPFDKLKIDQSFVRSLGHDSNAAAIIRSVIGLGRSLGMTTIAEGVETAQQLAFLRREGCDQAQGYHLGRPVPADEIDHLVRRPVPSLDCSAVMA
ncbi:MAG TPA: EAL domain-containing protein [Geminicoccus sp.]|jgi:diguanylate cyclase (GGDEF)-like protein|uniref:putative bifunctional diguanylate cyclase/phosphodiesterase n=1 Tax=Geminicoccus sp. TaxID=2024832 RepID=UPI002E35EA44|nr:EAL domain-containing protein [Geminicoccus sp.]HEX2525585.1 EAL domain-containing protein [Geminicoccus sp.]